MIFGSSGGCPARQAVAVAILLATAAPFASLGQNPFVPLPTSHSPLEPRALSLIPEDAPLPPLDVLLPRVQAAEYPPIQFQVHGFRFEGNHVFTQQQLEQVVAPYSGRAISAEELEEARLAVSAYYAQRGYINSGAVLDDQDMEGGFIVFRIVEGTLNDIDIRGNRWLRSRFIKRRIEYRLRNPLQINQVQDALLLLNDHPMVAKVNADLQPGGEPGQSRLVVNIKERFPIHAGLEFSNDRPASVGAEHLDFVASHQSLTANGDQLDLRWGLLSRSKDGVESGFENLAVSYTLPLSSWDTSIRLSYQQNDYTIIEEPFAELGIDGRSASYDITLRQPLYKTLKSEFALSLTGSHRRSESFLQGQPFSLSPGAVNGESNVTVIRFGQEWFYRTQQEVLALRSSFHLGVQALDATQNGTERDGEFFSWLGQAQYIRRLDKRGSQIILRGDFQWTDDQLLSLEQFSIGGLNTVRGYRENQLVRDKGAVGSAEVRIPLWLNAAGRPLLQLAGFYDIGAGWDVDVTTPDPRMIHSAGAGLIFSVNDRISAAFYWAHRFTNIDQPDDKDLQDRGISFRMTVLAF